MEKDQRDRKNDMEKNEKRNIKAKHKLEKDKYKTW